MTKELHRMYRRFRTDPASMLVGRDAEMALRNARTYLAFQDYESAGLARIRVEFDDDYERHDFDGADRCTEDHPCSECRAIERGDGPVVTIAEWRPSDDAEWEIADSCGGHVGYNDPSSPFENCYVIDEMAAVVEALDNSRIAADI